MKQILREEDLPLTGEFRPSAVLGRDQPGQERDARPDVPGRERGQPPRADDRPPGDALPGAPAQARARSTSTTSCSRRSACSTRRPTSSPSTRSAGATSTSTSTRTRTGRSTCGSGRSPRSTATCAVVGDDDQSIYSWRGADLRNILDFERDWPDAAVVKLERNYRSTQLILDAAHAVVSRNTARKDKKLWTENAGGVKIQRFEAYNEEEEAEWIARQVEGLVGGRGSGPHAPRRRRRADARFRARDIAVMYRMNAQSRAIEESFLRYGIRYQLIGGTRFYARREVKDALAYLRILRSDTDSVSFERIINVPARAIGDKTIEVLRAARRATRDGRAIDLGGDRARGARRGREPRAADAQRAGRVRGARPPAADPGRRAAAARAARRGPRGVRLPGDAGRRLGGRRGALGEPARAALGHDPLRRPRRRRTRSTGCSRRPRSSPTRTRTRATPTR